MAKRVKLTAGKREEIRNKMLDWRKEAEEGNDSTFNRMSENEQFKIGKQWDPDDVAYNESKGKFSLTVNEVLPIILDIAGTQEENPLDYKARNIKGGTLVVANILTSLAKKVMDDSYGREEASRAFESGVTTARGFMFLTRDYTNDPINGELVLSEKDPFTVLPDPTCKEYDYNKRRGGAKYIILDEWVDKEAVEAMYPGQKEEIKGANYNALTRGGFSGLMSLMFGGSSGRSVRDDYRKEDDSDENKQLSKNKYNYRVSSYYWREWKKCIYLQKKDDPLNYFIVTDPKDFKRAREAAEMDENIKVIETDNIGKPLTTPQLNLTIMVGDILVEHIEDPFDGAMLFPGARFAAYFDHGYEYPPVENLVGPQKLINYTFSSLINLLKKLANTGYIVDRATQDKMEWLEDHGGEDGVIIKKEDYGQIERIKADNYPTGFDIITERGKQNMREIAQIQLETPRGEAESGKALAIREQQAIKTKGIIFRNWNNTNKILARTLIDYIRFTDVFSDEEILAIIDEDDLLDESVMSQARNIVIRQIQQQGGQIPQQPQQPNPIRFRTAQPEHQAQMFEAFQEETRLYGEFADKLEQAATPIAKDIILKLVRQRQQGRYGVTVDTSLMAPTMRMARRMETLQLDRQLIEGGRQGVSRKKLIEMSDVPDQEEIIAEEVTQPQLTAGAK